MITRREAARSVAVTALSYSRILGANDRIGLGVIGTGGRGTYVKGLFQKNADVEVRALCDVYPARFKEALATAPGASTFGDHRKLLESRDIDAVLIGSPDHWHKDHAVDAMKFLVITEVHGSFARSHHASFPMDGARRCGRALGAGLAAARATGRWGPEGQGPDRPGHGPEHRA